MAGPAITEFARALALVVVSEQVLDDPEALEPYRRDTSPFEDVTPTVVARVCELEQIPRVLALASAAGLPVVARGAGYSLSGLPGIGQATVVIDVSRMDRVLAIDHEAMTVTAQAGILCSDLERACLAEGLIAPTVAVPVSRTTIGGVLSGVMGGGIPKDSPVVGRTTWAVSSA